MNFEQAIKDIQDTLVVADEIERRQAAITREHAEILHEHNLHLGEIAEFHRRTEQNLSEITDKLSGLIGSLDHLHPPPA